MIPAFKPMKTVRIIAWDELTCITVREGSFMRTLERPSSKSHRRKKGNSIPYNEHVNNKKHSLAY